MSIPTQRKPDYKSAWIFPILGIIAAFTYALLVFPNSFAPAGVGGISTMLQYCCGTCTSGRMSGESASSVCW